LRHFLSTGHSKAGGLGYYGSLRIHRVGFDRLLRVIKDNV
jgi:hypothetical protein